MTLRPQFGSLMILLLLSPVSFGADRDGASLYRENCSVCHGDRGDGRSRAQGSMVPPPRDFTTPQAAVELGRERMLQAVRDGRPGTAMAAWGSQLSEPEIAAVVDYVRNILMRPVATAQTEAARRLYAENCSVCHGDDGRGAKWTLTNMNPPPRNFTAPAAAAELSRDYMLQTVAYGKANTAMPGFQTQLAAEQIAAVVDYVRSAFMRAGPEPQPAPGLAAQDGAASASAGFPGELQGDYASGEVFYLANCSVCHGVKGDGKGPRAYFILPKPRDFQHPAARHGLNRPRLYQAIAEGTRGTEMPAWDKVLTPQQIADVAEFVYLAFIRGEPPE